MQLFPAITQSKLILSERKKDWDAFEKHSKTGIRAAYHYRWEKKTSYLQTFRTLCAETRTTTVSQYPNIGEIAEILF